MKNNLIILSIFFTSRLRLSPPDNPDNICNIFQEKTGIRLQLELKKDGSFRLCLNVICFSGIKF